MTQFLLILSIISFSLFSSNAQAANESPVVLELFTSQSCSSCPEADMLLKTLTEKNNSLLALSYHIDYWDRLGWKDTYSSPANTKRQHNYAARLGGGVYTPELVVNGSSAMIGSDEESVINALAHQPKAAFAVTIAPQAEKLAVTIKPTGSTTPAADIIAVTFDRNAKTEVSAGENGGRTLESINNVTSIEFIGQWPLPSASPIVIDRPSDSVAILLQALDQKKIMGAAFFSKN